MSIAAPGIGTLKPILGELGLASPTSVAILSSGDFGSFRVDLTGGDAVVLKTYGGISQAPRREAYASKLLSEVGFPMTRFLAIDETMARLPYRFAITNYLPGEPVASFRDEPGIEDAYRQTGALARKLHAVPMAGYGALSDSGLVDPISTNRELISRRIQHCFQQFRVYGGDEALAQRLETVVAERKEAAIPSKGPVFAHDDLHPNNLLAMRDTDGQLRLSGLIDFGNSRADDAVSDLAKTLFCSEHNAPGSTPFILQGYGPIDHPDPEGALWFYTLLHRVIMWWWLRHVNVIRDGDHNPLIDDLRAMAA